MKKFLLMQSVAVLWGCSDFAGQWEESYGVAYAQSTDPGKVLVCLDGSTKEIADGDCKTEFLCEDNAWVPQNYFCNGKKQRVMCEDNETTTVVDGACTSHFVCYDDFWVAVGSPVCVYSSSSFFSSLPNVAVISSSSSPVVVKTSSSSRAVVVKSSSSVKRSSSSIAPRLSSSSVRIVSTAFPTWLGADGVSRVNTLLDNGYGNSGYWYSYADDSDGGASRVDWPASVYTSLDSLAAIVEHCSGICGTAILDKGKLTYQPFVGIGFNIVGGKPEPEAGDATAWGGLCISYISAAAPTLELGLGDLDAMIGYANPAAALTKSTTGTSKHLAWTDFKQPSWYKGFTKISGAEAAAQLVSVKFKIQAAAGSYGFNICAIGPYNGTCPATCSAKTTSTVKTSSSSSVPRSSSSKARSSSSVKSVSTAFPTWIGANGDSRVDTRLDNGSKTSGYWFTYSDDADGGGSRVVWPVSVKSSLDSLDAIVNHCNGICGSAVLDKGTLTYQPFVGIGFNVVGEDITGFPEPGDASAWGGLCITYTSEAAPTLELGLNDYIEAAIGYATPAAALTKSTVGNTKSLAWSDFKQPSWYKGSTKITGAEAAKQLVNVKFKIQAAAGSYDFNICAIGPYNGSCPSTCK